nr:transglutaminaseTgpA domain-containing protein [Lysinibacillus timonensis]
MKTKAFHIIELALYYIVVFFILQEWLIPIMQLTKTGHLGLILAFVGICLLISLLNIHFIISWIIKLGYIAWFIINVYTEESPISFEGLQFFSNEIQFNLITVFSGRWLEITDSFRTFLFFVLIWMLIYLIHHWVTVRKTIFYFLVLTIFFIATLDTFTEYDGSYAIVKVVLLGLIMTVFLYVKRLMILSGVQLRWYKYFSVMIPAILLIGITSVIAILLPKSEPQWPDPVPYIKAATGQGDGLDDGNGISKVGYGTNDSKLGGSFVADDTVVFMAYAESKQYWRVETKDLYTSKGWEQSISKPTESAYFDMEEEIQYSISSGPEENEQVAYIRQVLPFDFIFQPYGLKKVAVDESLNNLYGEVGIIMNTNSEKLYPYADNRILDLDNYSVEFSKPTYLYSELQSQPTEQIDSELFGRYLQLPDSLPQRVEELANEIVKDSVTPYQKARAIESYFSQNNFRYETENVAVPGEDEDYVDQFLFETKVGYCDNFSSSMVVLLRSVGIPARWVKGFVGGDIVNTNGEMKTYEITNNNAHSWVEAYIPDVGWVNFEPTIGFSNMRSIDYDIETDYSNEEMMLEENQNTPTLEEEEEKQQESIKQNGPNFFVRIIDMINKNHILFVIINLSILAAGILLLISRRKWLPKVYIKMNKKKVMDESSFETMFSQLLRVLELRGLKRHDEQTLQSFAKVVDHAFGTSDMSNIIRVYEQYIYSKEKKNIDFSKLKESWEYLINRSSS